MSKVPDTVTQMREQIRQAILLSAVDNGVAVTAVETYKDWGAYKTAAQYPLIKAWGLNSVIAAEHFSGSQLRQDTFKVCVAPWVTASDYEPVISGLMESLTWLKQSAIQERMDDAYAPFLGRVEIVELVPLETSLQNPAACMLATLRVDYRLA